MHGGMPNLSRPPHDRRVAALDPRHEFPVGHCAQQRVLRAGPPAKRIPERRHAEIDPALNYPGPGSAGPPGDLAIGHRAQQRILLGSPMHDLSPGLLDPEPSPLQAHRPLLDPKPAGDLRVRHDAQQLQPLRRPLDRPRRLGNREAQLAQPPANGLRRTASARRRFGHGQRPQPLVLLGRPPTHRSRRPDAPVAVRPVGPNAQFEPALLDRRRSAPEPEGDLRVRQAPQQGVIRRQPHPPRTVLRTADAKLLPPRPHGSPAAAQQSSDLLVGQRSKDLVVLRTPISLQNGGNTQTLPPLRHHPGGPVQALRQPLVRHGAQQRVLLRQEVPALGSRFGNTQLAAMGGYGGDGPLKDPSHIDIGQPAQECLLLGSPPAHWSRWIGNAHDIRFSEEPRIPCPARQAPQVQCNLYNTPAPRQARNARPR